jgi:tetratricopeptide (TPR) repeat protein
MAGVEPYSPCPCGSGQKFKWCCHKVEAYADKSRRLFEGGQAEAAIKMLDEGLRKEPGNPWLLTRKAVIQIRQGEPEPAKTTLRQVLQKNPKHFGALILLTRCVLETEGPVNGAGMFQLVLSTVSETQRPELATLARVVALLLAETRLFPAALKHFELVEQLGDPEQAAASAIRSLEGSAGISPWLKDRLELAKAPTHLDDDSRRRFDEALGLAKAGHWAPAASIFDPLAAREPGGEADYNLGLCRLWLGDEPGAAGPIRRRSRQLGQASEAVDLEILAQLIEPIHSDDRVEHVQLTWPLRNRQALLASLRSKPDIFDDGPSPIDPNDPESPEVDTLVLLDRPAIDNHSGKGLTIGEIPRILGRVSVGQEIAALETHDDGRVDSLGDRFTALAGTSIAPAHPRTKVLDEDSRSTLALVWEWLYPEGLEQAEADRLDREQKVRMLWDVWPVTSMPFLGFRTPEQAARDSNAAIPLRAALCQYEQDRSLEKAGLDFKALRARLKVEPEPAINPKTVDLDHLPFARLTAVPANQLDDDRLLVLYRRARRAMVVVALEAASREIVARPEIFSNRQGEAISVYSDLASLTLARGEKEEAYAWIAKGRQADPPARRGPNAPLWDMIEVRLKARAERPEVWVPDLAIVMERYGQDPTANQIILMNLVELGLVRMSPNPDNPEDILLDSRPLQAVLAEFGPRVTTTSGRLGVSATKPDLWTPGGPNVGSGGALWTPGSGAGNQSPGEKPKLIIPGC